MNSQIQKKLRRQGHVFVENTEGTSTEHEQAEKPFFQWYWENVLGYSSEEYCREYWREVHRGHTIGPKPKVFRGDFPSLAAIGNMYDGLDDTLLRFFLGTIPAIFFYLIRQSIRKYIQRLQRPTYYERERDRRIELGRQRRSITLRTTKNAKPTFDEIRAAWNGARHSPEGALRLGGMLEDLECYVNNLTIGNAVEGYHGRRGGIKRLLQDKAPDLFEHYAALMRYKSIARRFRQACGLVDPYPASAVLPMSSPPRAVKGKICSEQIKRNDKSAKTCDCLGEKGKSLSAGASCEGEGNAAEIGYGKTLAPTAEKPVVLTDEKSEVLTVEKSVGVTGVKPVVLTAEKSVGVTGEKPVVLTGEKSVGVTGEKPVVLTGVKSWVLDGFVFAYNGYWVERDSYQAAIRVLKSCENSVISLEAALALEIDPNCVTNDFLKREFANSGAANDGAGETGNACDKTRLVPNKSSDPVSKKSGDSGRKKSGDFVPNKSSVSGEQDGVKFGGGVSRRVAEWLRRRLPVA